MPTFLLLRGKGLPKGSEQFMFDQSLKTEVGTKQDADYIFYELTRSICPDCRRVIDAQILLGEDKVFMRKRCPEHGLFEALVYADAQAYTSAAKFNKRGGEAPPQHNTHHKRKE